MAKIFAVVANGVAHTAKLLKDFAIRSDNVPSDVRDLASELSGVALRRTRKN